MWGWVTTWRHGEAPGHRWAQLTPPWQVGLRQGSHLLPSSTMPACLLWHLLLGACSRRGLPPLSVSCPFLHTWGPVGAAAAGLQHSRSSLGSEPHL